MKKAPKASIYQRKSDNRWVGSISAGKNLDGTRKRLPPIYGDTEDEVRKKINKILYEIQTEQYREPSKDMLVSFLKEYHRICAGFDMYDSTAVPPKKARWQQTTAYQYKQYIDAHIDPYFKKVKLTDIKTIDMDKFYNYKLATKRTRTVKQNGKFIIKDLAPMNLNTVLKLYTFLNAAFEYAKTNEIIIKNPNVGTVMSTMTKIKYEPSVYTPEDYQTLLDCVDGTDEEIPIILAAGCGLRRGEICGLKWGNIDFNSGFISIDQAKVRIEPGHYIIKSPKTEKSHRRFRMPRYVLDKLLKYYLKIGSPDPDIPVITKWKPQSLSGRFENIISDNHLKEIRFHDLRHYNATIMLQNGVSDKVAAERLGHSNVATLHDIYQHVLEDMDDDAADKINTSEVENEKKSRKKKFKVV